VTQYILFELALEVCTSFFLSTLENTEGTIKNGQFRETGNIGYTRQTNKTKTQHNMYWTTLSASKLK